jgi:hypothetical protein
MRWKQPSPPQTLEGRAILVKFSRSVMKGHLTLSGEFHEGLDRRLAEFRRPPRRHLVFLEKLQSQQARRIRRRWSGSIAALQPSLPIDLPARLSYP